MCRVNHHHGDRHKHDAKDHAHELQHDLEVGVHAVAELQVGVLLDAKIRLGDIHVKLAAQRAL